MKKVVLIDHVEQAVYIFDIPEMYEDDVESFLTDGNLNEVESFNLGDISFQVLNSVTIKIS